MRLLGTLEALDDRGSVLPLGGRKQRIVFAALAINGSASSDRLIDLVWGDDPPARPDATLQVYVSTLRRVLRGSSGATIDRGAAGYRLVLPPHSMDVERFSDLVGQGLDEPDPARALDRLDSAMALWRGPVLADLADEPFVREFAVALVEQSRAATVRSIECLLELGRHERAIAVLERLTVRYPEEERIWELLMTALYRSGRPADALAVFSRAREAIIEATGLDPSPSLRAVQKAVLDNDADLLGRSEGRAGRAPTISERSEQQLWQVLGSDVIGRVAEIDRVLAAVEQASVVTVVGPPGVGKTAVAAAAARRLIDRRPVAWCDLDYVSGDDLKALIDEALERSVGGGSAAQPLLVLDGATTGEQLTAVLAARVTPMLLTRVAPLGVTGEVVVYLEPLDLEAARELFAQKATRIGAGQAAADAPAAVDAICRTVDGLPLGIELAAAELLRASPQDVLARLVGQVDRLGDPHRGGPDRHRSLGAAFLTAVHSLPPEFTDDLVQLTVFRGGWTRDAHHAVLGAQAADRLDELVRVGLVWPDRSSSRFRYRMPAAVADLVRTQGELREATVRAHAAFFAGECRRWRQLRSGARAQLAGESLRDDGPNARAALQSALRLDDELAAAVAVSIGSEFHTPAHVGWFHAQLADLVARGAGSDPDRHRLLVMYGNTQFLRNNEDEAQRLLLAGIEGLEPTDDFAIRGRDVLAQIFADRGDPHALDLAQEAVDAAERTGRSGQLTSTLDGAVLAAISLGRFDRAREWTLDALAVQNAVHDDYARAFTLTRQAWIEHLDGADGPAIERAVAALELARRVRSEAVAVEATLVLGQAELVGDPATALSHLVPATLAKLDEQMPQDLAEALLAVAAGCALLGADVRAVELLAAADRRYQECGAGRTVYVRRLEPPLDALTGRMDPASQRRAQRAGRMLTDDALRPLLTGLARDYAPPGDPAGRGDVAVAAQPM